MPKLTDKFVKVTHEEAWVLNKELGVQVYYKATEDSALSDRLYPSGVQNSRLSKDHWCVMNRDSEYYVRKV